MNMKVKDGETVKGYSSHPARTRRSWLNPDFISGMERMHMLHILFRICKLELSWAKLSTQLASYRQAKVFHLDLDISITYVKILNERNPTLNFDEVNN